MTLTRSTASSLKALILLSGIAVILFPMYITIITAMKTPAQSAQNFFAPPTTFYLDNFVAIIQRTHFFTYVRNSFLITAIGSLVVAIVVPMVSYAIARNMDQRRYYRFLYYYIIFGIFVPFQVIMVPLTTMMSSLRLMNIPGLIIISVAFSLVQGTFLMTAYVRTVPRELDESAEIDGANRFVIFVRIIYPLITPIVATYGIIRALWMWNDFLLPLLILNRSQSHWTLPLFQYNFQSIYTFQYNLAFASFFISILPIVGLYLFVQRYIIAGLTSGALKG